MVFVVVFDVFVKCKFVAKKVLFGFERNLLENFEHFGVSFGVDVFVGICDALVVRAN